MIASVIVLGLSIALAVPLALVIVALAVLNAANWVRSLAIGGRIG